MVLKKKFNGHGTQKESGFLNHLSTESKMIPCSNLTRYRLEKVFCGRIISPDQSNVLIDDKNPVTSPTRIGDTRYGGTILICGKRSQSFPFHCSVGPDWPLVAVVYFLIISINVFVISFTSFLGSFITTIGISGFLVLLVSYSCVVFSDPGIVFISPLPLHQHGELDNQTHGQAPQSEGGGGQVENKNEEESRLLSAMEEGGGSSPVEPSSASKNRIKGKPSDNKETIECGMCEIQRPITARHCTYCGVCIDGLDHHCPCKPSSHFLGSSPLQSCGKHIKLKLNSITTTFSPVLLVCLSQL
jgi:hypothetical protein